jgi:hypothetical protein
MARRWGWLALLPALTVCAADSSTGILPPGAIVDPTLLPTATGQHPGAGTYGRSLSAGQTYVDPVSGVLVLKLTDASTPVSNGGVYAGYSEGGPNISQPWVGGDGHTYYTVNLTGGAAGIGASLVDIRYDTFTPSNWRVSPTIGRETAYAFSLNPATPQIFYYCKQSDGKVHRYNTATNANADTGVFPWLPTANDGSGSFTWLQVNLNDTWIVGMYNSTRTTVGKRLSDGLETTMPSAPHSVDEPHIDREYPIVYLATTDIENWVINLETGATVTETDPSVIDQQSHGAVLRGLHVASNWWVDGVVSIDRFGVVSTQITPMPSDPLGNFHFAGQWVFNNPNNWFTMDQWQRNGARKIYLGMMGFVNLAGDVRILAAHDAIGGAYGTGGQPHPTLSPDGRLVMWTSNMNGSGRFDVFVARVPTR